MTYLSDLFPGLDLSSWDDSVTGNETLLLNFNGTDGSTTITDETGNHTVTAYGDAQLDTAIKKFGSASLILDGTGDYVATPYSNDFEWWSGDFTLDCWVYATSWADWHRYNGSEIPCLIGSKSNSAVNNDWSFGPIADGRLRLYYYTGTQRFVTSTVTLANSVWHHLVMQYKHSSGLISLLANGELIASDTKAADPSGLVQPLQIGAYYGTYLTGQIDSVRITKGTARYAPPTESTFDPPTEEPSA